MGKTVDTNPTRKMLVSCDLITSTLLASLGWLLIANKLNFSYALLFGFAIAAVEGFFNPTVSKAVPELVNNEADLESAVAYQSSTQYMASFGGAMLGAGLINLVGIPNLVALTCLNFFISAMIEITIKFPNEVEAASGADAVDSAAGEQALNWKKHSFLLQMLIGFGLVNLFATPDLLIMPVYVQRALHAKADVLALVEAAIWMGILAGTFLASYIKSDGKTVLLGVICMLVSSVAHVFPGLIVDFKVFAASLFVSGLTVGLNNVKFVTMFQKIVPQEVKGSFFARMQAIISFTFPIAYLSFGFLSDVIKTPHLCLIQSVGIFFTALWFARLIKKESVIAAELV